MASISFIIGKASLGLALLGIFLIILYKAFSNKIYPQGLTRARENITYEGGSSNNSENTPRTFSDINANNITSEFEEPLPLYIPPANPNHGGNNVQSYGLGTIRVQEQEQDDSRIERSPTYKR